MNIISDITQDYIREDIPAFSVGDTLKVHFFYLPLIKVQSKPVSLEILLCFINYFVISFIVADTPYVHHTNLQKDRI